MKKRIYVCILFVSILAACGNDDQRTCITCTSPQTIDFVVCEESDGNASVNGENTGTSYAIYLDGLQDAGASCGE